MEESLHCNLIPNLGIKDPGAARFSKLRFSRADKAIE